MSTADREPADMPVNVRSIALTVIALAAGMYVLQWAQEVFIPIVLSVLISYALDPIVTWLIRLRLPRVIASYNAGPVPVSRWANITDKGDPLLWIESIPYWETRYYVPAVLRNMWVYQGLNSEDTSTLKAMAEHKWPAFPTGMTRLLH